MRAFNSTSVVDDFASLGDPSSANVVQPNAAQPWLCTAACLAEYVRRTPPTAAQLFVHDEEHEIDAGKARTRAELMLRVDSFLQAHRVESHHRRRHATHYSHRSELDYGFKNTQ